MRKGFFSYSLLGLGLLALVPLSASALTGHLPDIGANAVGAEVTIVPEGTVIEDLPNGDPAPIEVTSHVGVPVAEVTFAATPRGDLITANDQVVISEDVNGNVIVAGGTVDIMANIANDVVAAGGTVSVDGTVYEDVLVAGGTVGITGTVVGGVVVFGGTVTVSEGAVINGNLTVYGGDVRIRGTVDGNVEGAAGNLYLEGTLGGNVDVETEEFIVRPNASIAGDVTYSAIDEATIPPAATVGGTVVYEDAGDGRVWDYDKDWDGWNEWNVPQTNKFASFIMSLLGYVVVGLLLWWTAPKLLDEVKDLALKNPGGSFGWGLLWAIALPLIGIALMVTIIGIPFGFLLFVLYGIGLFLSRIFMAHLLGEVILKPKKDSRIYGFLLGLLILVVAINIPVVGWLINFVATVFGFGAFIIILYRRWDGRKKKK